MFSELNSSCSTNGFLSLAWNTSVALDSSFSVKYSSELMNTSPVCRPAATSSSSELAPRGFFVDFFSRFSFSSFFFIFVLNGFLLSGILVSLEERHNQVSHTISCKISRKVGCSLSHNLPHSWSPTKFSTAKPFRSLPYETSRLF